MFLAAHAAPRRRRRYFWTGGAPPPPTEIERRARDDTMTSAHSSTMTSAHGSTGTVINFCPRGPPCLDNLGAGANGISHSGYPVISRESSNPVNPLGTWDIMGFW